MKSTFRSFLLGVFVGVLLALGATYPAAGPALAGLAAVATLAVGVLALRRGSDDRQLKKAANKLHLLTAGRGVRQPAQG